MHLITPPIIPVTPIMPYRLLDSDISMVALKWFFAALLVIGISFLISWVLTKVMNSNGFPTNRYAIPISSCTVGFLLFLRFGLTVTMLQGLFLFFTLLYASLSDLKDHSMDDFLWVLVLALSLVSIPTQGLGAMAFAGLFVLIPQLAMAVLPPHKTLGGADIKLSACVAFLLGGIRGIVAYLVGLVLAVVFMSIYNHKKTRCQKMPFALVPFIGIGAMIAFFI